MEKKIYVLLSLTFFLIVNVRPQEYSSFSSSSSSSWSSSSSSESSSSTLDDMKTISSPSSKCTLEQLNLEHQKVILLEKEVKELKTKLENMGTVSSFSSISKTFYWMNGNCMQQLNGNETGRVTEYHSNGDRFEGVWVNGTRAGSGVLYYANGDRYKGSWSNGERSGQGTINYANGDR